MKSIVWRAALLVACVMGLSTGVIAQNSQKSGPTILSTTTCPGAGCLQLNTRGYGGVAIGITNATGSWTVTFEGSIDCVNFPTPLNVTLTNSTTAVTTATAGGTWQGSAVGLSCVRVRLSTYVSGSATVTIQTAASSVRNSSGGGGGGGTPGGSDTQVQYNNAGAFGGSANFTYDATRAIVGLGISGNVGVGVTALDAITSGTNNTAVGLNAGTALTTGSSNTVVGVSAGLALAGGGSNVAVGASALQGNVSGANNVAIGASALEKTTNDFNVAVGYTSMKNVVGGNRNAAFGTNTLEVLTSGTFNTAIGNDSMIANVVTSSNNTAVGYNTGPTGDFSNTLSLGTGANPTASNTAVIGNASVTDAYFGSTSPATTLHAAGAALTTALPVSSGGTGLSSGTSGGVLAYTASGTLASSGALTANAPVIGGGAGVAPTVGTRSGNTTTFATTTGTLTSGDCAKFDASGNVVANGSACGGAPGGSTTQLQYNNASAFAGLSTWTTDGTTLTGAANGIGTSSAARFVLSNTTAAAAGAQQYSPRLQFTAQGWKTTATAASQTVDWVVENQPVQGTTNPTTNLVLSSQVNAGGYTARGTLSSAGLWTVDSVIASTIGSGASPVVTSYFAQINAAGWWVGNSNAAGGISFGSGHGIGWASATTNTGGAWSTGADTGLIRNAAGIVEINNGAACSTAANCASIKTASYRVGGTTFTASGCSNGTLVGGASAGSYASGTTGACTVVVTMGNSQTATNGWACHAANTTTTANLYQQSASTTTTATFTGTTVSGDVVRFACTGY